MTNETDNKNQQDQQDQQQNQQKADPKQEKSFADQVRKNEQNNNTESKGR